jgi:hypothetical protein
MAGKMRVKIRAFRSADFQKLARYRVTVAKKLLAYSNVAAAPDDAALAAAAVRRVRRVRRRVKRAALAQQSCNGQNKKAKNSTELRAGGAFFIAIFTA